MFLNLSKIYLLAEEDVIITKERLSYSSISLLSDIGGSLGMFLGFSFLMLWDAAVAVTLKIRQAWISKNTLLILEEGYLTSE